MSSYFAQGLIQAVYRDNGKENGNYHLWLRQFFLKKKKLLGRPKGVEIEEVLTHGARLRQAFIKILKGSA